MTCSGCQGAVTRILGKIEGERIVHFIGSLHLHPSNVSMCVSCALGVKEVKANLETKVVEVVAEDAVEAAVLHAALMKWSTNSGKSVELVA